MSVTRTFTVTVVSTGSGNKYFIDGVQQATLELVEGATFRFDQSDSSNGTHPLRFSTTSDGTHGGGSEYTTGVTTNGTPGSSGAYTQITVATDAPTLYYYCSNHSGMGGQANTPNTDFWGAGTWGANLWGISEAFTTGWGAQAWNDGEWGEMKDPTVFLTGVSATVSLGDLITFPEQGWGRDTWNAESWGESSFTVELTAPDAMTSNSGPSGWSNASYGDNGWGMFTLNPADVVGLTGQSLTSNLGSTSLVINAEFSLTGVSATTSVGSIDPTQEIVGLGGQALTSAVGTLSPADVVGISGLSSTSGVGSITVGSSPIIAVTGQQATVSVGSLSPADAIGLTGVAATSAVGTLAPADVMGLTGVSSTASVAAFGTATGFGIQAYQAIDTGSNTSYTNVA